MIVFRKTIALLLMLSLTLPGCGVRPGATYQNAPPTAPTPPIANAPAPFRAPMPLTNVSNNAPPPPVASPTNPGTPRPPTQTFQIPPGGAAAAPAPANAPEVYDSSNGFDDFATNYATPVVLIAGTVVAAGLFIWGNLNWFK